MKTRITGYWTFFCNPAKWEIDKFLATNVEYDTYQVTEWQKEHFESGQLAIIRVGIDRRTKRQIGDNPRLKPGIYAIVEILSKAKNREQKPDKFWINWTEDEMKNPIVEIRYLKNLLDHPILLKDIKEDQVISRDSFLIKGFQASSMPLQKIAFERIIEIIGDEYQIFENIEEEPLTELIEIQRLEEKYRNATPQIKEIISKRIERSRISQEIKKITRFKCLVCEALGEDPYSFRKATGEFYVETHHIIPVSAQKGGTLGLSNIITVCENNHRQLHYGNVELMENNTKLIFKIDGKKVEISKINSSIQSDK